MATMTTVGSPAYAPPQAAFMSGPHLGGVNGPGAVNHGMLAGHPVTPGAGDAALGALHSAYTYGGQTPDQALRAAVLGHSEPAPEPPPTGIVSRPPSADGQLFDNKYADQGVRVARQHNPERAWGPKHFKDTVYRAGQHYLLTFGVGNLVSTVGALGAAATQDPALLFLVPAGQVLAGVLTVPSEVGLANGRVGGIANQAPKYEKEDGRIQRTKGWIRDRVMDDSFLWGGFVGWYAIGGTINHFLGLDPAHDPASFAVKIGTGIMAGVFAGVGAQYMRDKMGGSDLKVVEPKDRGTAYLKTLKDMVSGNPLRNKNLMTAIGRGVSLLPFAVVLYHGLFKGDMGNVDIGGMQLFPETYGPWRETIQTIGLLIPYLFRNDVANFCVKLGNYMADLGDKATGRASRPGPEDPPGLTPAIEEGFAPEPTAGSVGGVGEAQSPHFTIRESAEGGACEADPAQAASGAPEESSRPLAGVGANGLPPGAFGGPIPKSGDPASS